MQKNLVTLPKIAPNPTERHISNSKLSHYQRLPSIKPNIKTRFSEVGTNVNKTILSFNEDNNSNSTRNSSLKSTFLASIENFDELLLKYNINPTYERRQTLIKLNNFKKKCSLAIAKNIRSIDAFTKKNEKPSVTFITSSITNKELNLNDKLHIGSTLSFDGQCATLECIEDLIRTKLSAELAKLLKENLKSKFSLKFNKNTYENQSRLIERLSLLLKNKKNSILPVKENSEQNLFRKALISKYIDEGMTLLDEINENFKSSRFQQDYESCTESSFSTNKVADSLYSFNSTSESKSDSTDLLDVNIKKSQKFANRFFEWKRVWLTAF